MIRLKECREKCGLSQKAVAATLKVAAPSVSNWESGKTSPTHDNLEKLADLYGVSIDYLLGRDVAEEQPKPAVPDIEAAKVALFGGDGVVTDEMWEEALFAAQLIKERHRRKNDQ